MPCGAFTDERLMGRYGFAPKVSFGLDAEPRNLWSRDRQRPGLTEARFFLLGRLVAFRLLPRYHIMCPLNLVLQVVVWLSNWGYFSKMLAPM